MIQRGLSYGPLDEHRLDFYAADAPAERPSARQRPGGLSVRARVIAVLVGLLVLIAIGAVAWSAWKDATLTLGAG